MIQKKDITAIILAGGKSSRMGTDKGWIKLEGLTFISRIVAAAQTVAGSVIIVSDDVDYDQLAIRRVGDIIPEAGPLGGVFSGLFYSESAVNVVLSCDVPLINHEVLNELIAGYDSEKEIIQLESQGKTMPLVALYKKQCMHPILAALKGGERRVTRVVAELNPKTIPLATHLEPYVRNINTKEELKELQHELKH